MTHTLNRTAKLFTALATIYIMTLSTVYVVGTINTVNEINGYQTYLHEHHLEKEEFRKSLSSSSPEFSAAAKDPYFKSEEYRNIAKPFLDNEQSILKDDQNMLATYKRQTDHFVFAREAYKNLEESFPQDTVPVMDEEMHLRLFLQMAHTGTCSNDPNDRYDPDPNNPYLVIAKKYNFCSTK